MAQPVDPGGVQRVLGMGLNRLGSKQFQHRQTLGVLLAAGLARRPRRPWSLSWGAIVWIVTVAGGMLLRIATGDTAQLPFIIVATITLGVFLLGWRVIALLVRRRRASRTSDDPADDVA